MITLTLLHPVQSTPVQSWSFEQDPAIRIGRAVDNHVVLYSAVVSRYHVEIRLTDNQWEVVNLGTNGTYVDGKRVHQAPLANGSIMRLARSGPNIQICIDGQAIPTPDASGNFQPSSLLTIEPVERTDRGALQPQDLDAAVLEQEPALAVNVVSSSVEASFYVPGRYPLFDQGNAAQNLPASPCDHQSSQEGTLICTECGFPIRPTQTLGEYQVLKPLSSAGNTLMAWRKGTTVVLKTLPTEWRNTSQLVEAFESQARVLCQLEHPGMPKFFEAFAVNGQPYLVSEMIYGPNLNDWVAQRGPVPQYQAVQWAIEVCRLLDYIHQQNPPCLHRKIQPSNLIRPVMPRGFSQVVLVDFGELQGITPESGTFVGAGGYTAPEQQIGKASSSSDLYALGATLIYWLTGQDPDAFYRLGDNEFRLQIKDVPSIGPHIANIIQQLTHPQPAERFESAALVAEALQQLL
ncbi:MAG: FHA domain-containing serine/threonine-protein kinase [Thermosynechococcaceae cyanobacterium]